MSGHNLFVFTPVLKAVLPTLLGGHWVPLAQPLVEWVRVPWCLGLKDTGRSLS